MSWSPGDSLVIGISSRALFRLDAEDQIYREQGTDAFLAYQRQHEEEIIERGVAFPLIKALMGLNNTLGKPGVPAIEVVIVSKNHPECAIRIKRSLQHHGVTLKRAAFSGGQDILPHLHALKVDLFLSKEEDAVKAAIASGIAAGLVHGGPEDPEPLDGTPVIAFDGDAVLFSDDADRVYQQDKMAGFEAFEFQNIKSSLPPGPLHKFAIALEKLREGHSIDKPPFRIALITARDLNYCERPIRTLREFGIRLDHAFFCSDMSKAVELAALKPLIFFDDNPKNCAEACASTPTVRIPLPEETKLVIAVSSTPTRPERFLGVCKLFLKKSFDDSQPVLLRWSEEHLGAMTDDAFAKFTHELERSAKGTPAGKQRRAVGANNEDLTKLLHFVTNLKGKYTAI